jgi:hypothetical protein
MTMFCESEGDGSQEAWRPIRLLFKIFKSRDGSQEYHGTMWALQGAENRRSLREPK